MNRPYSTSELEQLHRELFAKHRLGEKIVTHYPCLHKYRVKKGGRKEQFISDSGDQGLDDQTCSVCFKLRTSASPEKFFVETEEPLTRNYLNEMDSFYRWLYRHDFA